MTTRRAEPIRSIHVAGVLRFDPERDTRLDVGLIKIQAGDDAGESGFDCEEHVQGVASDAERAVLEVGTAATADRGGTHGAHPAGACERARSGELPGDCLLRRPDGFSRRGAEPVLGEAGSGGGQGSDDRHASRAGEGLAGGGPVIITATHKQKVPDEGELPERFARSSRRRSARSARSTERALLSTFPLAFATTRRTATYRGEVANLSRNVVVESADPAISRGHTMYHRYSSGSISYAEFRHLGKTGKLGKYSLHFHRVGDTMRGSSVVGASIWESGNRWLTIHGTNSLVVRDCVGYRSVGHGFFLEDGTEVENILDGNLAVQAFQGAPLKGQVFSFDRNEGAGFWWANSLNAFMRNVAVECDQYGFRYEAPLAEGFDGTLTVRGADGGRRRVDIRTLPFLSLRGQRGALRNGGMGSI